MSEIMQPTGPAGTTLIRHERRCSKAISVWMEKDEAMKLYACRAALRECVALLDESLGYVTTNWIRNRADYVAQVESAITNARKILKE